MIISVAVDPLNHQKKKDIIKTRVNNVINYLQFARHMVTPSRRDPGCFQATPVVVVGAVGAPAPHPAEIICSSLLQALFVTLVITVVDICARTDSCPAEVFAQSLCIKEQESLGSQKRNNG